MTDARFDELIHAPTRLAIVALLAASEWADFRLVRDSVGLSDSALSKQFTTLEGAGYIEIKKSFLGKRPRTTARLTRSGRRAFERHVTRLQELVAPAGASIVAAEGGRVRPRRTQPSRARRNAPTRAMAEGGQP